MKNLKKFLRDNWIGVIFIDCFRRIKRYSNIAFGRSVHFVIKKNFLKKNIVRMGTDYGGWTFVETKDLKNSVIISAGLGEDASFDVEYATKYKSMVIIIDPTPRAIKHFNEIKKNIGKTASKSYPDEGDIPIDAYDLSSINDSQLILEASALWIFDEKIKFFEPPNPEHVSFSINNFQNNYSNDTDFIEVDGITLEKLFTKYNINKYDIPILKMDIEGAEIEIISYLCDKKIFPKQLLIEFDELNRPSRIAAKRIKNAHRNLITNGYSLIWTDNAADFLYVHESFQ